MALPSRISVDLNTQGTINADGRWKERRAATARTSNYCQARSSLTQRSRCLGHHRQAAFGGNALTVAYRIRESVGTVAGRQSSPQAFATRDSYSLWITAAAACRGQRTSARRSRKYIYYCTQWPGYQRKRSGTIRWPNKRLLQASIGCSILAYVNRDALNNIAGNLASAAVVKPRGAGICVACQVLDVFKRLAVFKQVGDRGHPK
jgi:hypothetical protein